MKRTMAIALILCLILSLCACADTGSEQPMAPTPNPNDTMTYPASPSDEHHIDRPMPSPPAEDAEPSASQPEVTAAPEDVQPIPTPEAPPSKFPYTIRIENPAQGIYKSPSYDSEKCGMVIIATVYTIVDEATDDEGYLWGRLKSGAGWVDIDSIRSFKGDIPLVTANFADMNHIEKGHKEYYPAERYDWGVLTDIRVTAPVTNVKLLMLEPLEYTIHAEYCSFDRLEAFESFVAELYFSGDFTTYGLSLTDEDGMERIFAISTSGRNGELVVREVTEYTNN